MSPMLYAQEQFQRTLRIVVQANVRDPNLHDDFIQELTIHIWKTETARPHQTPSWYRKSCRFRLRDLLRAGRSLDASKRRDRVVALPDESADPETQPVSSLPINDQDPFVHACADDALDTLRSRLAPKERFVMELLLRESTTRQIAGLLGISLRAVSASINQIRAAAAQLGLRK